MARTPERPARNKSSFIIFSLSFEYIKRRALMNLGETFDFTQREELKKLDEQISVEQIPLFTGRWVW